MRTTVVIGSGKIAEDCLRLLAERPGVAVKLLVHDPEASPRPERIEAICRERGVPALSVGNPNRREIVERVARAAPDLLLSINNQRILKRPLLSVPRGGTLNFHNGPLPRYRGVNVPVWAIVNGEREHAVTWHWVDEGIDTGAIALERAVPIEPDDTGLRLIFRCIVEGTRLFEQVIERWLAGDLPRTPQRGTGRYYARRDVPNDGWIDFGWEFARLERFVRGLDFRPYPNPMAYPRAGHAGGLLLVNRVSRADGASEGPPGTVLETEPRPVVAVRDGAAVLEELMDADERPVPAPELARRLGLRPGDVLRGAPAPEP